MKITKSVLFIILIIAALTLAGCSDGLGDMAVIAIDLGADNSREAINLSDVTHSISLSGPSGATKSLSVTGPGRVSTTVAPGQWMITVMGYYEGAMYSTGSGSVMVRAGQTASVTIYMAVVFAEEKPTGAALGGGGASGLPDLLIYGDVTYAVARMSASPAILSDYVCLDTDTIQVNISSVSASMVNPAAFEYQWNLNGVPIPGEIASTYAIAATDLFSDITVTLTHPEYSGSITSDPMGVYQEITNLLTFQTGFGTTFPINGKYIYLPSTSATLNSPIGNSTTAQFTGIFDGNGNWIGITAISIPTDQHLGLYAVIGPNGVVKNFDLSVNFVVSGISNATNQIRAGGVAGVNDGTIKNVSVQTLPNIDLAGLSNGMYVGGIAGENTGSIENCYVDGVIVAGGTSSIYAGGIAGKHTSGVIAYCWVDASISQTIGGAAGCITGDNTGTINNCVVLGSFISGAVSTTGRIWGTGSGIGSDNYGLVSPPMVMTPYTPIDDITGKDGADVTYDSTGLTPSPDAGDILWWWNEAGWFVQFSGPSTEEMPWVWSSTTPVRPEMW